MIDISPNLDSVEARHRQIVDSATDTAIISTDLQGCVISWNKGAERIIGFTEAEMAGRPVDVFFTAEDRATGRMASELAIAAGTGHARHEGWRVRKDGTRFWASGEMTPLRDGAGAAVGFVKIVRDRTAERSDHEDLITSQEQLRMAQSAGGVGVFTLRVADGRLNVTPEFCRLFGLEHGDDLTPEAFEALVVEEDREIASGDRTRATGEASPEVEYRIRRATDQSLRWIHRRAQFIRDADGRVLEMVGVATDITQRRRAEDALRRSEAQFRALAQVLPNHVWTARQDGALDWCNDRFQDYCGLTLDGLLGLDLSKFIHPDDAGDAAMRWKATREMHQPFETEFRIRRHDGVFRWHLTRAVPVESEDGRGRWIGSNTDIEDQKAVMASLEASNENLELRVAESDAERDRMWQLSTDVMIVADFEGLIRAVNPAWTNLLGWSADEMVGAKLTDFVHPDDVDATLDEVRKLEAGITVLRFENRYHRKDGGLCAFNWTAVPDAGFLHAVGRDVTAEHAAAEELERAQDALRQSQKMEAVGQLTGGIAHDFNNLLTGIIGSLDMMQRRIEQGRPVDMMRYVSTAMTAANRAAALTHRLLAFSRRQPLDPRPVEANRLVSGMEDLLRRSIGEAIRLEMVSAGGLWKTKCDAHQLENAILNLAINARDAMPDGGLLTIETCNAHLDSAYAALAQDV
jgi:PAS domain S-box-containing protein